jgi:hypothetical protein
MPWNDGMAYGMAWDGSWMEHMDRMLKESMSNHFLIDLKQAQDYSNSKIRQAAPAASLFQAGSRSHPSLYQSSRTVLGRSQSQFSMEYMNRTRLL